MDVESIISQVATSVGLAEGEAGVRDTLRAIARSEPVAARDISRAVELPVPLVTAVCNELRKRGVVDRSRPVRLTDEGRAALAAAEPDLPGRCPTCAGRGFVVPDDLTDLAAELTEIAERAPEAKLDFDQTHCTVDTKVRRVLAMYDAGALAGRRILVLGDDDLTSVAIARFAAAAGVPHAVHRLTVVDVDQDLLDFVAAETKGTGVEVETVEHDLRRPLPAELAGAFDVAFTDPPYTVPGAELFLSRAVAALGPGVGHHVFFSFGARRPVETLEVQQLIGRMGLAMRALVPNFNDYVGAGILAGTSHLHHLRTTGTGGPSLTAEHDGPLYTAETRSVAARPYRCVRCRAVHRVGPGERWTRIAELQLAGCPACGGDVFRPMALRPR